MSVRMPAAWVMIGLFLVADGCSRPTTGERSQASRGHAAPASSIAPTNASIDMVGIWLGKASLDRTALGQYLNTLTDAGERARIEEMAKSFESIAIGMEFRGDGMMEAEVEILPANSAPIRETTTGTWNLVSSDDRGIEILCAEQVDGETVKQSLRYDLKMDKDHIATIAPVGIELQPFQPRFEFERRLETDVAEQPGGTNPLMR